MYFQPNFFYDNDAGLNTGGGLADTVEEVITEKAPAENTGTTKEVSKETELPKSILSDEELKRYNFDSKEALFTFLDKQQEQKEISPEEQKEKENIEKATFLKFAAEQKLLNVDEYNQFENLKSKPDRDLVFENYLAEYKADHDHITDEKELLEAATEDFEYEYKLKDSLSEAVRKKGEAKLAREAKALRSPHEQKIAEAQNEFKEYTSVQQAYPKFEKFVDEAVTRNTPDKLAVVKIKVGDSEIDIDIPLTKEDRDKIAATFKNPKTFASFTSSKPEELQASIDDKIQGWLLKNKKQEIVERAVEIGKGIGTRSGSNIGAENPYSLQAGGGVAEVNMNETLEQSNARIAQSKQRYNQGR